MLKYLRGIDIPAPVVGIARGLLEAAVIGGLIAGSTELKSVDLQDMAWAAPFMFGGIRFAESLADHIDPSKQRAP